MPTPSHVSKPSLDQLSAFDHAPLSPSHTNIQLEFEDGVTEEGASHGHEVAEAGLVEPLPLPTSEPLAASTDPSRSGEVPSKHVVGWRSCVRGVLAFPSLRYIFPITLVLSFISVMFALIAGSNALDYLTDSTKTQVMPSPGAFSIMFIGTFFLLVFVLLATRQMVLQLVEGEIQSLRIVGLYLATIVLYGDIYLLCLYADAGSFSFATITSSNIVSVWIACLYFSVSTVSSTGYGDILPVYALPKVITATELVIAILYHVGVFAVGLQHFQNQADAVDTGDEKAAAATRPSSSIVSIARDKMRDLRARYPRLDRLRKIFIASVLPISLLLQVAFFLILHLADSNAFNRSSGDSVDTVLLIILFLAQVVQFVLILLMSLTLIRQINRSYVSPSFLLQSWFATVSLFTGIYAMIYLLVPDYEAFHLWKTGSTSSHPVLEVLGTFAWFSLCTMTTTGFGDVYPIHLASRLAVSIQMVVSVCYTVVVLGQALSSTGAFLEHVRDKRQARQQMEAALMADQKKTEEEDEAEVITLDDEEAGASASSAPTRKQVEPVAPLQQVTVAQDSSSPPAVTPLPTTKKRVKARAAATLPPRFDPEQHQPQQQQPQQALQRPPQPPRQQQQHQLSFAELHASRAPAPHPSASSQVHSRASSRGMFDPDPAEEDPWA